MSKVAAVSACCLLLFVIPASAKPQCDAENLLRNPGCEDPLVNGEIPGWTRISGSWTRRSSDPEPGEGSAYFFAGAGDTAELFQDVDVHEYVQCPMGLAGVIRTRAEIPASDLGRIVFEFRSAGGEVLRSIDSGEIASTDEWYPVFDCCEGAPEGTQILRVRLIGIRRSVLDNDACFDALRAYPIGGLPVQRTTWGRIKSIHR